MDNIQIIHNNVTVTHSLCSNQFRKPNHSLYSILPRRVRIWPMIAGFSKFYSCFNPGLTKESQMCCPNQSYKMPPFLVSLPLASTCQ